MYEKVRTVSLKGSVDPQVKNLQVVSFDSDWKEVYIGASKKDSFTAVCPNNIPQCAEVSVRYVCKNKENARISCSKWCPMENCTILVLGSQFGIQILDWDGGNLVYEYDFEEQGLPPDELQILGVHARGVAAVGTSLLAVGLHTGDILVLSIELQGESYLCNIVEKLRGHLSYITDLASSSTTNGRVLASGDSAGTICIWKEEGGSLHLQDKLADWVGFPINTLSIWNRYKEGLIIAGYGSGHIRMFNIETGNIVCELTAHSGWITGMDLASGSGLLLTCSEDSYVRVWQLALKGPLVEHRYSQPIHDSLLTGAKFLDPNGSVFCVSVYDSTEVPIYQM
ncbi:WD repeat-containing protein 54 [Eurytemora carolleeae]|uniref:WD repeat-containing protein 54 n=1 Tax=Eurytemora carolleeae TaxID=1294199 RepID=UPI000C765BF9|nr:WD repeat-containing protein 54 [Eurytemora carolleeae]|eukprot:XP_023335080.1 WD repeat-containing protein 54-like [Eurytemora affinis]